MAYTPYTQKRNYQFRGPNSSEDYNLRVEENYRDLTALYNLLNELESNNEESSSYYYKELISIASMIQSLESRIVSLEEDQEYLYFNSSDQITNSLFDSTPYEISENELCTYNDRYRIVTPPLIASSSVSKIKFKNLDGTSSTSSSLEMLVVPISDSDDTTSAVIEMSQPYNAVINEVGRIWQRNVITSAIPEGYAEMYLYVRIPNDLSITEYTNCVMTDVFPAFGVDLMEISYSTSVSVNLNNTSEWLPLNDSFTYYNIDQAVGYLAPGAWSGDEILNAGPKVFYFPQKKITALRFRLKRNETYQDGSDYIYSYGMSNLDIRFDKFADSGSVILQFDAPTGQTISSINSITPHLWSVPEFLIDDCFSYEVIWETSFESGTYTTTPVPLSQRIWIKVTLTRGPDNDQIPVLTNLVVDYS
jgi:hypothetical protein